MRMKTAWLPFLAGAATGAVTACVLADRGNGIAGRLDTVGSALGDALDAGLEGLRAGRRRLRSTPLDLAALQATLGELPGGETLRLRDLGQGIVEVVGTAPDEAAARQALARLGEAPGVEVVVNRIWTPAPPDRASRS